MDNQTFPDYSKTYCPHCGAHPEKPAIFSGCYLDESLAPQKLGAVCIKPELHESFEKEEWVDFAHVRICTMEACKGCDHSIRIHSSGSQIRTKFFLCSDKKSLGREEAHRCPCCGVEYSFLLPDVKL